MENDEKIRLFNKSDTTLVYLASREFAKEIMGEKYNDELLYIHVDREYGGVMVYKDNYKDKVVQIDMKTCEYIQKFAEDSR